VVNQPITVSLVVDQPFGPGARHGLVQLRAALQKRGMPLEETYALEQATGGALLIAGTGASPSVARLLDALELAAPTARESLRIRRTRWNGREVLLVTGGDDRGLMYALLDVAERVGWAERSQYPFAAVRDTDEQPEVVERSLSIYTMHKAHFEQRFYDERYWARYLDMLARCRFNTFALLFAYESAGYFAPPYPYFFDVPGFPQVHVAGYTPAIQRRNLDALNRLIAMTHERGLDFTLGIWDHIYRGGVQQGPGQDPDHPLPWRVVGVTGDNLMPYSTAALRELLQRVPNLDAIQFRMHGESGLTKAEMDVFWAEIYDLIVEQGRGLRFDARVKGFPDHLIDLALQKGVNIRLCTKYWMEQMSLPFHPTHIHPENQHDRRHSYADLLRYPQRYKMHWRLWNGGTSRILLWGDPQYVRRFVGSTHLYDGEGFDVNEPLATRMASQDHDLPPVPLLQEPYRFGDYEFERYWHFFQLWGRLGYNPQTPSEVWEREFARRFGAAGVHMQRGLHQASQVLPRIVACNYPYRLFPTTRGWVEKQRMGNLTEYAHALPSDTEQFLSIQDEARCMLDGQDSAKTRQMTTSAWFARIAAKVLAEVEQAEQAADANPGPEFLTTMTDLRILAQLALYHAHRIPAAIAWVLYEQTGDWHAYDEALQHEREAVAAWRGLVEAADGVYADDLMMGLPQAALSGHWRDELAALQTELRALEQQRNALPLPAGNGAPWIAHVPVRRAMPGQQLTIRATVVDSAPVVTVLVRYQAGAGAQSVQLEQTAPHLWQGTIPGAAVREGLAYFIEATDVDGRRVTNPAAGESAPIAVTVTADTDAPTVVHQPITHAPASQPLPITAVVRDPSGVRWVHLRYRPVNQMEDFRTLSMQPTGSGGEYRAVIPAAEVDPAWDLMYFIEVVDGAGNGTIYPDLERETPYVVVRLDR